MVKLRHVLGVAVMVMAGGMLAGCLGGKKSIEGKYVNKHDNVALELKAGGKAVMTTDGKSMETTYDMDGPDKVIVYGQEGMRLAFSRNADGNLSLLGYDTVFIKE